jgi:hypothetical protein
MGYAETRAIKMNIDCIHTFSSPSELRGVKAMLLTVGIKCAPTSYIVLKGLVVGSAGGVTLDCLESARIDMMVTTNNVHVGSTFDIGLAHVIWTLYDHITSPYLFLKHLAFWSTTFALHELTF